MGYADLNQSFRVAYQYRVLFTENLFDYNNELLVDLVRQVNANQPVRVIFVLDAGVCREHEYLTDEIGAYCKLHNNVLKLSGQIIVPGGEQVKNEGVHLKTVLEEIDKQKICRHSFVVAVGGGAVLDMAGFAAGIAHRGVRLIRVPTTVLSQNDSGIGVKNSVNYETKKNFLGTFAPPYAVINDWNFLTTLERRDWIGGTSEAVKVALIRDAEFFHRIADTAHKLRHRNMEAMQELIYHCARLHMEHIRGGDPFEQGSSRPLDFGHWAAHKLEQLTNFELRHGEAVAIGMAVDVTYAHMMGLLPETPYLAILRTLEDLGFDLRIPKGISFEELYPGLEEFREHLGGELTISLISDIGQRVDVNTIDKEIMKKAVARVQHRKLVKL